MQPGVARHAFHAPAGVDRRKGAADDAADRRRRAVVLDEDAQVGVVPRGRNLEPHSIPTDDKDVRPPARLHTLRRGGSRSVTTSSTNNPMPRRLPPILMTEPTARPFASSNSYVMRPPIIIMEGFSM